MSRRTSAHARSKKTNAKKARRAKRQAARDANWIPDAAIEEIEDDVDTAAYLEYFHQFVTQRGWTYDDETSTDTNVAWFYEPSIGDRDATFTTAWISADDEAEFVWVALTDSTDGYKFEPEAFFDHIDAIEAYRPGDPLPKFDTD